MGSKKDKPEQSDINAVVRHLRKINYPRTRGKARATPKLHVAADFLSGLYGFDCPRELSKRDRLKICVAKIPDSAKPLPLASFANPPIIRTIARSPEIVKPTALIKETVPRKDKKKQRCAFAAWVNSDEFLRSYEWRKVRYAVVVRCKGRCEACGAGKDQGIVLHVDHIKPRRKYPELALDPANFQGLCEPCNHGKSNWDETDWRSEETKARYVDDWEDPDRAVDESFPNALAAE